MSDDVASGAERRKLRDTFAGKCPTPAVFAHEAKLTAHILLRAVVLAGPQGASRRTLRGELVCLGIPATWADAMIERVVAGGWLEPVVPRSADCPEPLHCDRAMLKLTESGRHAARWNLTPKLRAEVRSRL